jgi:hypothetical protein
MNSELRFRGSCGECGVAYSIPAGLADRPMKCRQCGGVVIAAGKPFRVRKPDPVQPAQEAIPEIRIDATPGGHGSAPRWMSMAAGWWEWFVRFLPINIALPAFAMAGVLATSDKWFPQAFAYLFLLAGFAGSAWCAWRWSGKWWGPASVGLVALVVVSVFAWNHRWETAEDRSPWDGKNIVVMRKITGFWTGSPIELRIESREIGKPEYMLLFRAFGPFVHGDENPILHGKWRSQYLNAPMADHTEWYWYGEEISEVEWMKRTGKIPK